MDKKSFEALLKLDEDIHDFKNELKIMEAERKALVNSMVEEILTNQGGFKPDIFMNAKNLKGDSFRLEGFKLMRHIKENRILNQKKFKELFPDIFNTYAEITLKNADNEVGENTVKTLCDKKISYSYEVVNMKKPGDDNTKI